jgi:hypothetical protein
VEVGVPVEFYSGSEVTEKVEPCSEWVVLEFPGETPFAMHPDTLVSVFVKAKELKPGMRIETGDKGQWREDGVTREEQRDSFKVKRQVKPHGTYMAGTARVRVHNAKADYYNNN